MFIYAITNDVNDKAYVGLYSGKNLRVRWSRHQWDARNDSQIPLHRAMRAHGIDKFHICSVWSGYILPEKLKTLEKYFIRCFRTQRPSGYNVTEGGDGSFGFRHSEEYKQSMRDRFISEETRLKMSRVHKGKTLSPQHKKSMSEKLRGNKHLLGHVHSAETRAKISAAGMGKVKSPETLRKMSELAKARDDWRHMFNPVSNEKRRLALIGRPKSAEERAKLSAAHKGKPKSEEHRRKVSLGLKKYFAEKKQKSIEVNNQSRSSGGGDE